MVRSLRLDAPYKVLPVLALLVLLQAGCSKTLITSRAPDGSATIRVKERCLFPDCVVKVSVQTGWWTEKTIDERLDCIVNFAHVTWSPDSRIAAILVDNGACTSIHVGYDLRASSFVPFEPLANRMRQSIIKEYGVRPNDLESFGGDPLEWAHQPGDGSMRPGVDAFQKKYRP